jgi:hypothetical protein
MEENTKNEQHLDEERLQDVTGGGLTPGWYEPNTSSTSSTSSRWSDVRQIFLANPSNQTANPADKIKFHQDAIAGLSQQANNHRERGNNAYADMLEKGAAGHLNEINRLNDHINGFK